MEEFLIRDLVHDLNNSAPGNFHNLSAKATVIGKIVVRYFCIKTTLVPCLILTLNEPGKYGSRITIIGHNVCFDNILDIDIMDKTIIGALDAISNMRKKVLEYEELTILSLIKMINAGQKNGVITDDFEDLTISYTKSSVISAAVTYSGNVFLLGVEDGMLYLASVRGTSVFESRYRINNLFNVLVKDLCVM